MIGTALALTSADLLLLHRGEQLGRVAVVDGDRRTTYGELQARVQALAARLHALGLRRGDRVVVHMRKCLEEVVALFACWRLGLVAVDVHASWTAEQLAYVAADAGARALLTDARRARELATLPPPIAHGLVAGDEAVGPFSAWPAPGGAAPDVPLLDQDLAAIMYTSGSTGSPKGVMFTHTNLLVGARAVARYTGQGPDERLLSVLPFNFDYGLNQLLTAFLVGARIVLMPLAMPSALVQTMAAEGVTGMAAVPPVWVPLVRYLQAAPTPLPTLRYVTNSGGALPAPILDALPQVFPGVRIHLMYGLTEAFRSTALPPERFAAKPGSIGRAVPNVETFVVVPGRGPAAPGEVGELVHRGSLITRGYWNRPERTDARIRPVPELPWLGDEKLVWSGDLVRMDDDGDLWFVGRTDAMIKSMGFRVSPTEVEDVVFRSGLVTHVVAFGVPDDVAGKVIEVCVAHPQPVDRAAVLAWARAHLPSHMAPRAVHVWPGDMPRTAAGKIDVPAVIRACLATPAADTGDVAAPRRALD
jgi:amino acid adenylation domain-containing protein